MIYDAQTNPRGKKLTPSAWPREEFNFKRAAALKCRIRGPQFIAAEATPARALLNHGVWRAWCPDCPFAAEDVWRGYNGFMCMSCCNVRIGHNWRPLIWPENWQQIEADLNDFPSQAQNWEPWGTAVDHVAVAQEWVDHAGVMIDPEHGLTDNAVGGLDDPETYTTPVLAVTNAIIASSDANVDKGDIRYFRQYLSANPAGANEWLQSSSADAAAWVARATAVLAAIGYTPVNKAGDTMSGNLTFSDNQEGVAFHSGGFLRDINTVGTYLNANGSEFYVQTENGVTTLFKVAAAALLHNGSTVWTAANDGAGSGLDADTLDGVQGSGYQTALGFTPARIVTGSYTGDGTENRTVTTTGITPSLVILRKGSNSSRYQIESTTNAVHLNIGTGTVDISTARIVSGGFEVDASDGSNENAVSFTWVAFG